MCVCVCERERERGGGVELRAYKRMLVSNNKYPQCHNYVYRDSYYSTTQTAT